VSDRHAAQIALMRFLSSVAARAGVADHVYVVGGAVRDFVMGRPIKDVDVVVDAVALGRGRDSAWFADRVVRSIPTAASYVTNQYGVAIITVKGSWVLDGHDLEGEVIEIANARKESYGAGDDAGKGYKPTDVQQATITEDVERREFTFNTLLWRMRDLAQGPDRAEIIDLTGCGLRDLEQGVVRCPRDPDIVFSDDPTRMLRLVKFVGRYGFKVPPDVAASVRRNAGRIAQAPWEAIGSILVHDIIEKPYARRVLPMMRDLGLIDAIAGMVSRTQPFRTYLERELRGRPAHLVADLLSHGLQDPTPPSTTTPSSASST
jgi:poly(A) polymerase